MKRHRGRTAARVTSLPTLREPFRRAIAVARRAAGLTQAALAAKLETTQSAIARLERGELAPSITTLARLEEALGRKVHVVEVRHPSRAARRIRHEAVPL